MKIELEYNGGQVTKNSYHRKHTHAPTGIERELFTKRRNDRPVEGSQETTWYHPKDKKSHGTFQDALRSAVDLGLVPAEKAVPFLDT